MFSFRTQPNSFRGRGEAPAAEAPRTLEEPAGAALVTSRPRRVYGGGRPEAAQTLMRCWTGTGWEDSGEPEEDEPLDDGRTGPFEPQLAYKGGLVGNQRLGGGGEEEGC